MDALDVIVFDLSADFGHFKVPYTTTSPLTLPVPSRTAIFGLLGAVAGLDKNDYLAHFQGEVCNIALGVKRPVKKIHIAQNLINTKNVGAANMFARMNSRKTAPHSPTRIEFLKDPGYRLYFHHRDRVLFDTVYSHLVNHRTEYTISLGISECLANFEYIGCYNAENIENNVDFVALNSILPLESLTSSNNLLLENDNYLIRVHLPLEMKPDRELVKTGEFLVEANGGKIKARIPSYYRINPLNENIMFF
ncbi:MAG TPA: type I-B CRISPR-associated protein Cas5b [Candidatus Kapabacteria bacterium]|nr:type I-B CRISPR-associated protein Cas5b [Candidatus Kapabacteria bacterium]